MFKENWIAVADGNEQARSLFKRHYSYRPYKDGRQPKLFVGPGEKLVLISPEATALFVWRKFSSMDNQNGVNCAVFRNESKFLSSQLILEAEEIAKKKWPGENRFYTYVNSNKILSKNVGCCFKKAGWKVCGETKRHRLTILEKVW